MSSLPEFPQELLDLFVEAVGELPESDSLRLDTLLACNLVSRSFNHISRRYLFKRIDIEEGLEDRVCSVLENLHQLLSWTHPSDPESSLQGYARYVKEFSFHFWTFTAPDDDSEGEDSEGEDSEGEDSEDEDANGEHTERTLATVMNALHGPDYGLQTLSLYAEGDDWNFWTSDLQDAVYDLFRSPRLRHLDIRGINNIPRSFLRGTQIKHLQMYECAVDENSMKTTPDFREGDSLLPYPKLEKLDLDLEIPLTFFESPHLPESQSSITSLHVFKTSFFDWISYGESLPVLSRSKESIALIEFHFCGDDLTPPLDSYFDLTTIRNLGQLCLYRESSVGSAKGPGLAVVDFVTFLDNLIPPSSLCILDLVIVLDRDREREERMLESLLDGDREEWQTPESFLDSFIPDGEENKWPLLDAALSRMCSKSSVRDVNLTIHFEHTMADRLPQGTALFSKQAIQLMKNSLRSFTVADSSLSLTTAIAFSFQVEHWDSRTLKGAIYYNS